MEVREIFERFGEAYFRDGEARVISRLLGEAPGVLATGGGAFMAAPVRKDIAAHGVSVWLDAALETLWSRVKDRNTRPLLQQADPKGVLAKLLEERTPTYAQAQVRVPSDPGISHDAMVRRILAAVRAHDLAHPELPPVLVKGAHDD